MIEFLHNYGLWIVLAGVFFAMHRFGMGCCGGGHQQRLPQRDKVLPSETTKGDKTPGTTSGSAGSCH
jgi:hypothetical protein